MNEFKAYDIEDFTVLALVAIKAKRRWLPHAALAAEFTDIANVARSDQEFTDGCIKATKKMYGKWAE